MMYSSIEKEDREEVIRKCYWPIFNLVDIGVPIGIEATGLTLEIINSLDRTWINTLRKHIISNKIEFIGSGYSQIIGPLVPNEVNSWNQKIGKKVYSKLLNCDPIIALVNEMAYSAGVVEHYSNNGYKAIVMEWNNPRKYNPKWKNEWRYFPQIAIGSRNVSANLIWADSVIFQKFQQYVHGEYSLQKYIEYLKNIDCKNRRFLPLYSNDVEIFDYRPGRYHNEPVLDTISEWKRIIDLYSRLSGEEWAEFVYPTDVIETKPSEHSYNEIRLESPEQPIPVKKQEKYNINRWALTGKDDLEINSRCYQIHSGLLAMNDRKEDNWKELCYLWSSDFRTHITKKRWNKYKKRLEMALLNLSASIKDGDSKRKILQTIPFSESDIKCSEKGNKISVENRSIRLVLDKSKGLSVFKCVFKNISGKHLFGTVQHGYFDDISFSEDYYSGHAVIERLGQHKITDLGKVKLQILSDDSAISLDSEQLTETYWGDIKTQQKISFESTICLKNNRVKFNKRIILQDDIWWRLFLGMAVVRPFFITFNPEAWDIRTLYYKTKNGGASYETYHPAGRHFNHSDIHSSLISSKHGLGSTDGTIIIGDIEKEITIKCNMAKSALIPSVIFSPQREKYFFRIQYSAREVDETVKKKLSIRPLDIEFIIE